MRARSFLLVLSFATAWLANTEHADAHRLDEYLQAARISVERSRVILELGLTPGVAVASRVLSLIDTNGDGRISKAEGETYAAAVLRSIEVSVDGVPVSLVPDNEEFPEVAAMNAGVGVIRLGATAQFPPSSGGNHQVFYRNTHQPQISVYLANALVPTDRQVEISGQSRDTAQHELRIDYRVHTAPPISGWWLALGLSAAMFLGVTRWRVSHTGRFVMKSR